MTYRLEFTRSALKEWGKLGETVRAQFKAKLARRLEAPHVPAARLHGATNRYKIKLRASGYRLVYEVTEATITVTVIAIGHRGRIYDDLARSRPD